MDSRISHIQKKLAAYQPQERGDHMFNPDQLLSPPYCAAAVLMPMPRNFVDVITHE
ncbi:MAG: hypothetical protein HY052_05055 [Proteobacteria bacterium]|nr:hypothetical protein [Pseudomonadota bacterium]